MRLFKDRKGGGQMQECYFPPPPPPGRGYLAKCYAGKVHFDRNGTPFVYLLLKKGTPFTYVLKNTASLF